MTTLTPKGSDCMTGDACRGLLDCTSVHVAMLPFRLAERMSDFMTQDATLFYKALY